MEFLIGATSAICAGFFTNPLEVVKTRFQLQGELQKRGNYKVHYRSFVHAFYIIGRTEGLVGLQKGLIPALGHQVLLNGVRLGGYQLAEDRHLNLRPDGQVSMWRTMIIGAVMGIAGSISGSPLLLAKIRLQSQAAASIAVGHQHKIYGMGSALKEAYREGGGILGLWRGCGASMPRLAVGSASQLTTFYLAKEFLAQNQYYRIKEGLLNTFLASMLGGVVVAIFMGPLDVISTRVYNQGVDKSGKGLLYSSYFDCVRKMWRSEGFSGFYKGIVPCYVRIGPHTVLCFVFWDTFKKLHERYLVEDTKSDSLT
uniref:Putative solute carrier family 25 member 35-like protein n=1 Tax=Panstrongylus megistus TaxID=65343 RepID=A0A069DSJ6_9HEMI